MKAAPTAAVESGSRRPVCAPVALRPTRPNLRDPRRFRRPRARSTSTASAPKSPEPTARTGVRARSDGHHPGRLYPQRSGSLPPLPPSSIAIDLTCRLPELARRARPVCLALESCPPLDGIEPPRLGLSRNRSSTATNRPGPRAAGSGRRRRRSRAGCRGSPRGRLAVAHGNDRVVRAPHDQHRHVRGQVQPVAGVDALAA